MNNLMDELNRLIGGKIVRLEIVMWPPCEEERTEQESIVKIHYTHDDEIIDFLIINISRNMWRVIIEKQNDVFNDAISIKFKELTTIIEKGNCNYNTFIMSEYPKNIGLIGSKVDCIKIFYIDEIKSPYGISFHFDNSDEKLDYFAADDGGVISTNVINSDFEISDHHSNILGNAKFYTIGNVPNDIF